MDAVTVHSRQAMAKGSSSFTLAARLFGRTLREDVWQLYAWCRYCDDQIDGQDHGRGAQHLCREESAKRLAKLRRETIAALDGAPMNAPAFAAFQRVALSHQLAEVWPLEVLDGFAMDVERRTYETVEDVLAYCWGVAGAVGVMMASIMGVRDAAVLRRAQDLGLACQLTNICRDIGEDAAAGRIYLPAETLSKAGLASEPGVLLNESNREALFAVASELLALAEAYYRSSRQGLRFLPFRAALAITAARGIYREIGRRILRRGPAALGRRMRVPKAVMAWLVLRGALVVLWSRLPLGPVSPRAALWSHI